MNTCSIEGCGKPALAMGWCSKHWCRWRRHGDPLGGGTPKDGSVLRYFNEVVVPFDGSECLIWPYSRDSNGYGKAFFGPGTQLVHRRACEEVNGPPPDVPDIQAAHSCGNGHNGCCNPHHVRWATRYENSMDRVAHGTHNRGERHMMAKLTEPMVLEIRALAGVVSVAEIAERYAVTTWNIECILKRKSWGWLLDAANDNSERLVA